MGKIGALRFLGNILTNRFTSEPFIVLDIGTFSVKALYVAGRAPKAFSIKQYYTTAITSEGINKEEIKDICRLAVKELRGTISEGRRSTNKVILGIGGGFVHGKTLTQTYIRDHPDEELNEGELSNIIQKVQQRNYEKIRRDFKRETARSELDVYILNGYLDDIKIDGYQVINPIGFKGKEVSCGLFNSYITKDHLKIFEDITKSLGLEIVSIISEPYAVFKSFYMSNPSWSDFVLIDVGASSTEISLVRKGRIDDIRSISIGGASFTKTISENLKVGFSEAENIKINFAAGKISKSASKKIEEILLPDIKLFLRGLEMVLYELSHVTLTPSNIYIYGGGSLLPVLKNMLGQPKWGSSLSFSSRLSISNLSPSRINFSMNILDALKDDVIWTVPLSLANTYIEEVRRRDEIAKLVRRGLRLIR